MSSSTRLNEAEYLQIDVNAEIYQYIGKGLQGKS